MKKRKIIRIKAVDKLGKHYKHEIEYWNSYKLMKKSEKKILDEMYNLYLDRWYWTYFPPFKVKYKNKDTNESNKKR